MSDPLKQSLDTIIQGVLIVDRDLRLVHVNRRYRELFRVDLDRVTPGTAYKAVLWHLAERGEFGPGPPADLVEARMAPVRARQTYAMDRPRADGSFLFVTGHELPGGGYVFTFTDVTERVQTAHRLEQLVDERTAQYRLAKDEAESALAQATIANRALSIANQRIGQSLAYARRIQASMLPDLATLQTPLHDIAALWRPVDVVGGDLFVVRGEGERCLIALLDCTGHGVPGAFMSAIAATTLDSVLRHHSLLDPAAILANLNRLVRTALRQDRPDAVSDDGLDAAVCLVEPAQARLTFAGARLPLTLQRRGGFATVAGDRQSLGYRRSKPDFAFANHVVALEPGMACYLYSDGLPDQRGGRPPRPFGRRRIVEALGALGNRPIAERVAGVGDALDRHRGSEAPLDDVTLVGFVAIP